MIKGVNESELKIIQNILNEYSCCYDFYFYGSRVKGNFDKTSDLDILIKGQSKMPLDILENLKKKFDESNLPYIVNFSDYFVLDSDFYKLIEPSLINYKD